MVQLGLLDPRSTICVLGYCSHSPEEIRAKIASHQSLCALTKLDGNYVIVIQHVHDVAIITSQYNVIPYVYVVASGGLIHGPSLSEVVHSSGIEWKWNFRALANYICFGHLFGTETLHANVVRTDRGSVVTYRDGRLSIEKVSRDSQQSADLASPDQAVQALCEEVARWWKSDVVLCLTGGLDSRLLLAALVAQGHRPDLFVVGQKGSFDRLVACAISERFGLRLYQEEILAADFVSNASKIAESTNGVLPLSHWPGVLLAARAPEATLMLGWNGEYARSYYLDKGFLSLALDKVPAKLTIQFCLHSRLRSPFAASESNRLNSVLANELMTRSRRYSLNGVINQAGDRGLGMTMDEVFLNQYGTNKTGADVAAITTFRSCVLPFFSSRWIAIVRSLPRTWKLGGRFHRHAINKLCSDLLAFPDVRSGVAVERTVLEPVPFYWMPRRRSEWILHFFNQTIYDDAALIERVGPEFANLSEIIDPRLMTWSQSNPRQRQRFFHLATVAIWYGNLLRRRQTVRWPDSVA